MSFVLPSGLRFEYPAAICTLSLKGRVGSGPSRRAGTHYARAVTAAETLTPPDVIPPVRLLLPFPALYEVSVLITKTVRPPAEEEAAEAADA